jgi:hypothetical protein
MKANAMALPSHISPKEKRNHRRKARARRRVRRQYERSRSCGQKVRHARPHHAWLHIRSLGDPYLQPYKCRHCGTWHIGHPHLGDRTQAAIDKFVGEGIDRPRNGV